MTTTVTSAYTGAGSGTWTIVDDTPLAIAAAATEITAAITAIQIANEKLYGTLGQAIPGSPINVMKSMLETQLQVAANMTSTMKKLDDLTIVLTKLNQTLSSSIEGSSSISYNLNKMVTTQQLAVADQIKNNKFQQMTTNAALVDAGKEPTVVTHDAYTAQVKGAVTDVSGIKIQVGAASLIEQGTDEAAKIAKEQATKLLATPFVTWIKDKWADLTTSKVVTAPIQPVKDQADKAERATIAIKAGLTPPAQDLVSPPVQA
jgi:hypothetical protein